MYLKVNTRERALWSFFSNVQVIVMVIRPYYFWLTLTGLMSLLSDELSTLPLQHSKTTDVHPRGKQTKSATR